ncbi:MAG: hypothetical protein WD648_04015 [Planctomycetaceae bacterium]
MFFRSLAYVACLSGSLLFGVGCDSSKPTPPSPTPKPGATDHSKADHEAHEGAHSHDESDHGHDPVRDNMLIADAGPYHVLLRAHLAAEGNELHVLFETPDVKNPKPMPIPVASFGAEATAGEGESQTLKFEPAPAEDRPKDEKAGTFSQFIAKAPWMKPDDNLLVVATFTVDGKELKARWKEFVPRKYTHDAK